MGSKRGLPCGPLSSVAVGMLGRPGCEPDGRPSPLVLQRLLGRGSLRFPADTAVTRRPSANYPLPTLPAITGSQSRDLCACPKRGHCPCYRTTTMSFTTGALPVLSLFASYRRRRVRCLAVRRLSSTGVTTDTRKAYNGTNAAAKRGLAPSAFVSRVRHRLLAACTVTGAYRVPGTPFSLVVRWAARVA